MLIFFLILILLILAFASVLCLYMLSVLFSDHSLKLLKLVAAINSM